MREVEEMGWDEMKSKLIIKHREIKKFRIKQYYSILLLENRYIVEIITIIVVKIYKYTMVRNIYISSTDII